MRLIDADALKQTFCAECAHSQCENCTIDYHFEHLAPTVDPVKHGRWVNHISENGVTDSIFCSLCDYEKGRIEDFNYCPNCGAKMDDIENQYELTFCAHCGGKANE